MTDRPWIADIPPYDEIHWTFTFQVLSVERSRPLLPLVGVPTSVTAAPEGLTRAARRFLEPEEEMPTGVEDRNRVRVGQLERIFAGLAETYGEKATRELFAWCLQHFISQEVEHMAPGTTWQIWSMIMPKLAAVYGHGPRRTPSPLSPRAMERFTDTVRARFSRDIERRIAELCETAEAIPLSAKERQWVLLEWARLGLPEPYPGADREVDAVSGLYNVIAQERAYRVWKDLDGWMSAAEREALDGWAVEAKRGGNPPIPPDLIVLPPVQAASGTARWRPVGAVHITYWVIRLLPSLAPPLWWTLPANVAVP